MLSRTAYNTILLLIFAFGCILIYTNYNGNEYMYLNSLCAGAIFLSHIYVNDYIKGKSKLTEILPLPIALLTSCFLLFSYLSAIQNPTGHQIFLGVIITLTYVIDLGMIDSFAEQNLEKKWVFPLLVKICLFLIAMGAIQISGLSWFKIILLFIAFLCAFASVFDRIQQLRDNKVIFSLIILIDIYLVYLSIKKVLITPDNFYYVTVFIIQLLLTLVANFNKEKVINSQQTLATENDKQNQITVNNTINVEEDDEDVVAEVRRLAALGSDVNQSDEKGVTSLMLAASQNRYKIVNVLIELGANIYAQDKSGKTALDYAKEHDNKEVVKVLRQIMSNNTTNTEINYQNQAQQENTTTARRRRIIQTQNSQEDCTPSKHKGRKLDL